MLYLPGLVPACLSPGDFLGQDRLQNPPVQQPAPWTLGYYESSLSPVNFAHRCQYPSLSQRTSWMETRCSSWDSSGSSFFVSRLPTSPWTGYVSAPSAQPWPHLRALGTEQLHPTVRIPTADPWHPHNYYSLINHGQRCQNVRETVIC